jgi:hypothetical protein
LAQRNVTPRRCAAYPDQLLLVMVSAAAVAVSSADPTTAAMGMIDRREDQEVRGGLIA